MIDLSTEEWKEAYRLVQLAAARPEDDATRAAAFDFLRTAESKRLLALAHLLQPGATARSIQAALVPLERVDKRAKITDSEMGIRTTDAPGHVDKAPFVVVADNVRSAFNMGGIFRTADFFGAERIVLCGYSPTPENAQVKKTALGADESTPWEQAGDVRDAIDRLRQHCDLPIVLFPGNVQQLAPNADALLLLSLISGRNAEWLIGQQVQAAQAIRASHIEVLPTGYILVDGGTQTAVQRISGTRPIAADALELIAATALAGEQSGKQLIYLEAGSGATRPVPTNAIRAAKEVLTVPLVVGGGITTPQMLREAYAAGADMVVVGNHLETHLNQLGTFADTAKAITKK